jgi:hypothetical protein
MLPNFIPDPLQLNPNFLLDPSQLLANCSPCLLLTSWMSCWMRSSGRRITPWTTTGDVPQTFHNLKPSLNPNLTQFNPNYRPDTAPLEVPGRICSIDRSRNLQVTVKVEYSVVRADRSSVVAIAANIL